MDAPRLRLRIGVDSGDDVTVDKRRAFLTLPPSFVIGTASSLYASVDTEVDLPRFISTARDA